MLVKGFAGFIGLVLPFALLLLSLIRRRYLRPYLLGMLCFFVSQIVLRLPLLSLLGQHSDFLLFQLSTPVLYALFLAFTAGFFEESGRFLFMKLGLKNFSWQDSVYFGLGHGLIEAFLFYGLYLVQPGAPPAEAVLLIGGIERVCAVLLHVGLSILIMYGLIHKQKSGYFAALLIHTAVDLMAVIIPLFTNNGLLVVEALLFLISSLLFVYGLYLKRKWVILK